jgi:RNA polymerase sigma factor (sigma-70 family)
MNVAGKQFPITRLSAILAATSSDKKERARGLDILAASYWMPVYKYLRLKWGKSAEDAEDLTQGFFAAAIEKNFFRSYDPSRARFRTFLRACLDGYVSNQEKSARAIKRGGQAIFLSLDFEEAESQFKNAKPPAAKSPEDYFEQEWVRSFFALAVDGLEKELKRGGKELHYLLFERYMLDEAGQQTKISYKDLAREFDLSTTQVNNYLTSARREFRKIVLAKLRELTESEEEYQREARALLGMDPR